ncbi:histidine kinase [Methylobacillus gramineus]|uniref:sensor histidine kinase n=1 Tax=Methylobacillus gramineus TaxID=755169 RepID=UPI001CFF9256|nr:histidine kinase [Methylobacillus gramineus]MCB5185676.1 histidine kinase [Methylobacillus gramineus]
MAIIKQNATYSAKLPDLRNLGICLRILILVNLLGLFACLVASKNLTDMAAAFTRLSAFLQPVLLVSLLALYGLSPWLRQLTYPVSAGLIVGTTLLFSTLAHLLAQYLLGPESINSLPRTWLITLLITLAVLGYLNLRQRALSPAVTEARLQALQARIRPHFLFNSINAVLSIIRSEPKQAETALMDMADLFRVLMADNRELVSLAQELALSRQYLALEKLRLDDRLRVDWQIDTMPPDALIPPLVLQPLLENAVYHGIEPMPQGGAITVRIYSTRHQLHIVLNNPFLPPGHHHQGNRMALNNIRERLQLHFDAEARLDTSSTKNHYEVHIAVPYRGGQGK